MHVYYVKTVGKTQHRKTYICASEDVLLLIINNIHNSSFLFSGKIMSLQDYVVILLHSVELLIFFQYTSFMKKGQSRVQLILVYFDKWYSLCIIDLHYVEDN